jgi:hypothetical protein
VLVVLTTIYAFGFQEDAVSAASTGDVAGELADLIREKVR